MDSTSSWLPLLLIPLLYTIAGICCQVGLLGIGKFLRTNPVNEGMSKRAIHKTCFESFALIGTSVLQVYPLRRLFERKLATSIV